MALPKKYRLKKQKDFERVMKQGKTVRSSFFFLKFLKNDQRHLRLAAVVPRRVAPTSVLRHQIVRHVVHALHNKNYFPLPLDVIVVVAASILGKSFEEIKTEISEKMSLVSKEVRNTL